MNNLHTNSIINFITIFLLTVLILAIILETIKLLHNRQLKHLKKNKLKELVLDRSEKNPILSPNKNFLWQLEGTFNPGAVLDDLGRVHLFYRAIGNDGISRIGHTSSKDGIYFDELSPYPVFQPNRNYGMPDPKKFKGPMVYDPTFYTSGGGWGGAEDPRVVEIDGTIYMTYVAFEGWDHLHMAVTSLDFENMKKRRWDWKNTRLMTNRRAKNWVLFPRKINGKFAIIHGLTDKVHIEYVHNLNNIPDIKSMPNRDGMPGYQVLNRKGCWDEWTRGAGAPPVYTDKGWLLFYNVVNPKDPGKYKIGAMILDLNDPSKIIYRAPSPVLKPDMHYENDGKPGVVYASGAVIKEGKVFLYYGAGDRHTGLATIALDILLDWLIINGKV